jgi:hypothetical protein
LSTATFEQRGGAEADRRIPAARQLPAGAVHEARGIIGADKAGKYAGVSLYGGGALNGSGQASTPQ